MGLVHVRGANGHQHNMPGGPDSFAPLNAKHTGQGNMKAAKDEPETPPQVALRGHLAKIHPARIKLATFSV